MNMKLGWLDITPWTTGDQKLQEEAGFSEGSQHCLEGWCVDNYDANTPFMKGYRRGWEHVKNQGMHGAQIKG